MFEIDNDLLLALKNPNNNLTIKSYQNVTRLIEGGVTEQRTAALSTNEATYKLKKSETSNTMLITGMQSGDIYKQTSVFIELERSQINRYQVANII